MPESLDDLARDGDAAPVSASDAPELVQQMLF